MTLEEARNVAQAMVSRAGQWRTRVGIGAVIAVVFFPVTGVGFAATWFAVYGLMQVVEMRLHPDAPLAARLGEVRYARVALGMVLLNNMVFGGFGAWELLGDSMIGLICGALLLGGAVVNAIMISGGSRLLVMAAVAPQLIYLALLPIGAVQRGFSALEATQLTVAGTMLTLAGVAAWRRLALSVAEREAAREAAEQANRAKSDFLATMSHEIRTPLNGVLGMAQVMAADDLAERQRERLGVITRSGEALLAILGDVLDLAKIEAGKLDMEEAPFELEDVIDRAQAAFHAIAESKGLAFSVAIEPAATGLWRGDAARLHQVLCNLISNAVKFTEDGAVEVRAFTQDDRLILIVEDTGPGVTEDQRERLFGRFVQADASTTRKFGGTGLGLAISRQLIALMKGTLTVSHVVPHGLAFRIDLPLQRATSAAEPAARDAEGVDRGELRVLAAEDHAVNRQVLTLLLSQAGIIPHIVEDGEQAVAAWRRAEWDLILMDVQMPVMDGPTAARTIRAEEAATGRAFTPIIALTANVMTHQVEDYRRAGMNPAVAKPIRVEALLSAIQSALTLTGPPADAPGGHDGPISPASPSPSDP